MFQALDGHGSVSLGWAGCARAAGVTGAPLGGYWTVREAAATPVKRLLTAAPAAVLVCFTFGLTVGMAPVSQSVAGAAALAPAAFFFATFAAFFSAAFHAFASLASSLRAALLWHFFAPAPRPK